MPDVLRVRVVLPRFFRQPRDGSIETVKLPYLSVAVRDIANACLTDPTPEELDGYHDLRILFERPQLLCNVHTNP